MLKVICSISLLLGSVLLTACGQSGALQLPSDPHYDKRAKYLLYSNKDAEQQAKHHAAETQEKSSASEPTTSP